MRVAYVCADPGVPVFGHKGCSIHVQEVVRAMRAAGAAVDLFTVRGDGTPPADLASVPIHALSRLPKGDPAARERAALAINDELRNALERAGSFDLVYERYSLWSYAGMEHARRQAIPGLLEVNAPLIEEQARYRDLVDRSAAERVAQRAFAAASALLAVSQEVATYLERFPRTHGRVHVVPNGVDPDRFPSRIQPCLPSPAGVCTIGFLGALKPWHGLDTLVASFAALHAANPASRLLLVGDGPERAALEASLAAWGVTHAATLTGAVPPEDVPGWLASMDVAVAPYPARDDFYFSPLKLYEYMAAGRAIVASSVGQIPQAIEDGVHGLLCPPGDPHAITAACLRLCADSALRARLGTAARERVVREYTWGAVVRRAFELAGVRPTVGVGA